MLIKALPHRSSNYFETVCCAGLGRDGRWRRQYPVPFRVLKDTQKFARWNWIRYRHTTPATDGREESQKVDPDSIEVVGKLSAGKRAAALRAAFRQSVRQAEERNESLLLIRPRTVQFRWRRKSVEQLRSESRKHEDLVRQGSFLQEAVAPLLPCPYAFYFFWTDPDGERHRHTCDDWETSTAFLRRREAKGTELEALQSLQKTYEDEYFRKGMAFGLGTHMRRQSQWLLVGVVRVDEDANSDLFAV